MKRNTLVEWMRFLFSLLVVGYHIQMSMKDGGAHFFANGAVAVEFFFLISGYFMARSVEKISKKADAKLLPETGAFMKGKIIGILPGHVAAMVLMILVVVIFDRAESGWRLGRGIPGMFLVQMGAFWNGSYTESLIIPEWYLSSMLLCMLVMFLVLLLLRKKYKSLTADLISMGFFSALALVLAIVLQGMPQNLMWDFRAMLEMHIGMLIYEAASCFTKKDIANIGRLKAVECIGYGLPVLLGFLPLPGSLQPVCMAVTIIGVGLAMIITFSGKGIQIREEKPNRAFAYLGSISLFIYLFHPVLIELFTYVAPTASLSVRMAIIFPMSVGCAALFAAIMQRIRKQ